MKQSTKLLSLVLALVMAFSCMTVIGNAALVKSEVVWDSLDDAALSPEQVADLALDLVDNDLLADMETVDLSILGELRLNKLDYILTDICDLRASFYWSVGSGLLGDLGDFDFDPLKKSGSWGTLGIGASQVPYQRSDGDLVFIGQLLQLLNNNASIVAKAAYGIGSDNGLGLGLIGSFLDLGDIGDMLNDIPNMLVTMLYDMLIYGSYNPNYENSSYPSSEDVSALPTDVDTLDEMADMAILNLLTSPQDYEWDGEGATAKKVWDMDSVLLPSLKAAREAEVAYRKSTGMTEEAAQAVAADYVTPLNKSVFGLLDFAAQYAIDDLGVTALNYNLKKTLMEAVDVDFNEISATQVDAAAKAIFDAEDYVTYIAYDCLEKGADGEWYYTTLKTVTEIGADGNPVLDEEGNEITSKERKYYKANMGGANEFAALINWDWKFVDSATTPKDGEIQLLYSNIVKDYDNDGTKSIVEGINDLLYLIYDAALSDAVKADFEALVGTGYVQGANSNLMTNVNNIVKYLLVNHGDMVFGSSSPYASLEYSAIKDLDTVDLIAMIGPSFFEDVMPQLIFPKNADGTYAFHDGVQIYEFGALVIREFITNIAPNVNYDAYIFAEETVTSENDRLFKSQGTEQWFNLILNMGMDIAYTYLYNITNFGDKLTYSTDGKTVSVTNREVTYPAITSTNAYDNTRWTAMLDEVILWCVRYVGGMGSSSVINGYDANTIAAINGPLNKLSHILNGLLPLGFVNGYSSANYEFDVDSFLNNGLKAFFENFDLSLILGLLGRNTKSSYNFLDDTNVANAVLDLVNDILYLVFRSTILQDVVAAGTAQSLDAVIDQPSLQVTIQTLLTSLYSIKDPLLLNALPVVGKMISGWGTEQEYNTPEVSLTRSIDLTNGATSGAQTVTVRNASDGVWRHYIDPTTGTASTDNQYQIQLVSVAAYDGISDTPSTTVVPTLGTQGKVDYGKTTTFTYTATGVPTSGDLVRFEIEYQVFDESGTVMSNGKRFKIRSYAWLNYNPTDANQTISNDSELLHTSIYTPQYVPLSNALEVIPTLSTSYFGRDYKGTTNAQTGEVKNNSGTVDGLTFATLSKSFANSSGGRYLRDVRNFDNYTHTFVNEDGNNTSDTYNVQGAIDEAAWKAANKTSGTRTDFSITLTDKDDSENYTFSLIYYDDIYYNKLSSLATSEMDAMRLTADYNLSGTVYADRLLTTVNSTDEDGEVVYRETNSTATAWIDSDENEYAASAVSNIQESKDDNGVVTAATGTVTVDGKEVDVVKVTKIDCATAINNYVAAFEPGLRGGMQAFNANSVYNFQTLYEALYVASNDVAYCKKTTEQVIAEGNGDNIDAAVSALKVNLDAIEAATTDDRDFTDYKMWRLDRLNDARDDARYFVNLQNDASNATVAEIDETFPYTSINEDDLRALVAGNATLSAYKGGTDNQNFVTALLEAMTDEERAAQEEWLANKKLEYSSQQLLDVEMASNYLTLTSQRLLPKYEEGVITTYLDDELTSVDNMIGDVYDDAVAAKYTERSWAKFFAAYDKAIMIYEDSDELPLTQKNIFDVKYELQCARNELVLVEDEADYSELEALIAQAENALANQSLYDNTAKELGQVLAELGVQEDIVNAEGDSVNLFPNSAYYIDAEPYAADDQEEIDDAATALKEALARLKFKGLDIKATEGQSVAINKGATIVADDVNTPDVDEKITATIATIAAEMSADAVKDLFNVSATGASVGKDNITVSNDLHYTVDTDLEGFAGTNSVVTFYTLQGDIKIPVATVKIIVNGDINGDGAVDVLDGAYAQLVSTDNGELEGCYFIAGNLTGDLTVENGVIDANDYGAIVNIIVA